VRAEGVPFDTARVALAGCGIGEDAIARVRAEFVELAVEGLVGRADAQPMSWDMGSPSCWA
jgi:hypothetical protein